MDSQLLELLLSVGPFAFLLVLGLAAGTILERRHFADIRVREARFRSLPAVTFSKPPADWVVDGSGLVAGSVVVSLDYFKRFAAALRIIFGGRIKAFEPLMDRGRREAILRMKQDAVAAGYDAIINVRLATSRIANANGSTTAGVELMAYGTGLKLGNSLPHALPTEGA
jgi:uncharacterized protein YbjQ (UPF0145 family)